MRGFGHILWTLGAGAAALGCYLVSLQVASSRAELERVEREIALASREIRTLETEIGTRGRLAQLERWNVNFLQLSAPEADQFVGDAYVVAAMARPDGEGARIGAPVILASAPVADDGAVGEDGGAMGGAQFVTASLETVSVPKTAPDAAQKSATKNKVKTSVEGEGPQGASSARTSAAPASRKPAAPTASATPAADPLAPLPSAGDSGTP